MKFNTVEEAIEYLHKMTKQQEIREGIADKLEDVFSGLDHWDCSKECSHKVDLLEWKNNLTGELLGYLHSRGVVIRVDRELPEIDFDDVSDIEQTRLMNSVSHHTVDILLKAGYVATEPLMHCPSCKKEPCTCPSINRGSFAKYVEEG